MLKQKALIYLIFNLLGSFLSLLSVFFISRYMGANAFGLLSVCQAFVSLFNFIGSLGFGDAHIKRISEGKDLGKCIGTFLTVKIVLNVLMVFITLVVLFGTYFISGKYPFENKYLPFFIIILVGNSLANLFTVINLTFAARLEALKDSISGFVQKFLNSVTKIIIAVCGLGIFYLAYSNLLAIICGGLVSIYFFRKYPISRFDKEIFKSYLTFAAPVMIIEVSSLMFGYLDKVFLGYFTKSAEVGYYSAGQSIVSILTYIGSIFSLFLFPTYSAMHAAGKVDEIRVMAKKTERYISIILVPTVCFMIFYADDIRSLLLGNKFAKTSTIIRILSIQTLFLILSQPYTSQLAGTNNIKITMYIGIVISACNIILNLVLVPTRLYGLTMFGLGSIGVALSLMISSLIAIILYRYFAYRLTASKPNPAVFKFIFISLLTFSIVYLTYSKYFSLNLISFTIALVISFILYLLVSILFKEITRQDVSFYLNILSIKKMKSYIGIEFGNSQI